MNSSRAIRQRTLLTAAAGAAALGLVATFPGDLADSHRVVSPTVSTDSHGGRQIALAAAGPMRDVSLPIRVRIPAIGVDSPLGRLGVDAAGALVPPTDFARAGWFAAGPVPGDIGPAVIAGHVDSRDGPAVFFRLADLAAGDEILVERADGTTARFTVSRTARYPKDGFPTEEVYGPTPRAELRLITCGGAFDADRRSYRDNIVVTAVLR